MFDLLNFRPHSLPNAVQALYKFDNDWQISVVSGDKLYGNLDDGTYEVAIFRPNGNMAGYGDVSGWNTKQQVSAMMWILSQL